MPPRAGDREAAARVPKAIGATALRFAAVASARWASRPVRLQISAGNPRTPRAGAANDPAALSVTPTRPARSSHLRARPRGRPPGWAAAKKSHPRAWGSAPRILGHYVRDEKLMTLEEAVRKLTSLPASRMGLWDRGLLRPGMAADVVAFDPRTIRDRATFEDPMHYSEGIPYVAVNGQLVVTAGGSPTRGRGRSCAGRAIGEGDDQSPVSPAVRARAERWRMSMVDGQPMLVSMGIEAKANGLPRKNVEARISGILSSTVGMLFNMRPLERTSPLGRSLRISSIRVLSQSPTTTSKNR